MTIALLGIISSSAAVISPSQSAIRRSYALLILTIASGTYLVVDTHSPMLPSCVSGLLYTGTSLIAISFAQNKLAKNPSQKDEDNP